MKTGKKKGKKKKKNKRALESLEQNLTLDNCCDETDWDEVERVSKILKAFGY